MIQSFTTNKDKVFFIPGDRVTIKHDIPNKPIMLIKEKVQTLHVKEGKTSFEGMKCLWFSTDNKLQEAIFNTKDLQKL